MWLYLLPLCNYLYIIVNFYMGGQGILQKNYELLVNIIIFSNDLFHNYHIFIVYIDILLVYCDGCL
jgi:hypothetical protein